MEKTLREQRTDNLLKAVNRQEGDYVPVLANPGTGIVGYSGMTLRQAMESEDKFVTAMTKIFDDLYCDTTVTPAPTATPNCKDIMGFAQFQIGPDDTTIEHVQRIYMEGTEYPELCADFNGFIKDILLPRKYPFLFSDDIDSVKSKIKAVQDDFMYVYFTLCGALSGVYADKYQLADFGDDSFSVNPGYPALDVLFDTLRGFKGTMLDLRRHYDDVKRAVDVIWNERMAPLYEADIPFSYPFGQQVPHIPAYLNPKQFGELYWPQEKKILEKMAAAGNKMAVILEGRWSHVLDYLLDAPKDSMILMVDDDDIFEVNKRVGHHQIIAGGAKIVDLKMKSKDQCIDYAKRVIDEIAPGGGFIFTTDKIWNSPTDICPNLFEVYNFAHEYSKH